MSARRTVVVAKERTTLHPAENAIPAATVNV